MNNERAAKVLQEIEARLIHPECGPKEQRAMRCLKTAIEGLLRYDEYGVAQQTLTNLCDQWEQNK